MKVCVSWPVLLLCVAGPVFAQAKKKLTVADYRLWHTLQGEKLSPDGRWVAYQLHYDGGTDTLFLQSAADSRTRYAYPAHTLGRFSDSAPVFTAVDSTGRLLFRNLATGKQTYYDGSAEVRDQSSGKVLLYRKAEKTLACVDANAKTVWSFSDVTEYAGASGNILIATSGAVGSIDANGSLAIRANNRNRPKKVISTPDNRAMAWLEPIPATGAYRLFHLSLASGRLDSLDHVNDRNIGIRLGYPALRFSPDGQRVLFYTVSPDPVGPEPEIQVWDASKPLEFVEDHYYGDRTKIPSLAVWNVMPLSSSVTPAEVPDEIEGPDVRLLPGFRHAIAYDRFQYEPNHTNRGEADIFLVELETGRRRKILDRFDISSAGASPDGKRLQYFREGEWWVYDIATDTHTPVTSGLEVRWSDENPYSGPEQPILSPGWSPDGKWLFLYDRHDIWRLTADGRTRQRLTRGAEEKRRYRIAAASRVNMARSADAFFDLQVVSAGHPVLEVFDEVTKRASYAAWSERQRLRTFIESEGALSKLVKAKAADSWLYVAQSAQLPPQLCRRRGSENTVLFRSNPHAEAFESGTATLINYRNAAGEPLDGILWYPPGYQKGEKRPMIVSVYELQSQELHTYLNPSAHESIGFNIPDYLAAGYLILLPDIKYRMGNPGPAALDCVEAAVKAVRELGVVDEKRIGIHGHSFGAYETVFIISRSNTFAAAVAGSGTFDLTDSYFYPSSMSPRSNDWRFEAHQMRMPATPFSDVDMFARNDPFPNAPAISTPLLHWAGEADVSVSFTQSRKLHLALRRLGKENRFLLFKGQGHTLSDRKAQGVLYREMHRWFDAILCPGVPIASKDGR